MFTGIVQGTVTLADRRDLPGLSNLSFQFSPALLSGLVIGASVALDGVCLTVCAIDSQASIVSFDVMMETLAVTNLGALNKGAPVHVERAARVGDEIGGHAVSGHVDFQAAVSSVETPENNRVLHFLVEKDWCKYIFRKGFICINGASLTVASVDRAALTFSVYLIPETLRITTFAALRPGSRVNIEIDRQTQAVVETVQELLKDRGLF